MNFWDWLKQSSTIRGIFQLLSALGLTGGWLTESDLAIYIGGICFIVVGLFNMWRSDSVQKAVDLIKDKVPIIIAVLLLPFLLGGVAYAADLVTDPQAGVVEYIVKIDGVETLDSPFAAEIDGSLKYNVDALAEGPHTFEVQAIGQGGWPSATFTAPFNATKPAVASGLAIVP